MIDLTFRKMQMNNKSAMKAAAVLASLGLLLLISFVHYKANQRRLFVLYNKWGTNDKSDHWGGVGSKNYEEGKAATKWDNSGWNADYHPRDSSSGDGESMEPAWWRSGPGANSEYTGHAMDGELYNPPDVKAFKPFFMRAAGGWPGAARTPQLAELGAEFAAAGEASPAPRVYPGIPAAAAYICKGGDCRYYMDS
uniref:Uncharacterized protein n=1 Tax=Cryptomonas curvata TaxID=233186 RepID=A0A7S0N5N5_9CRYP|mmetsp:Transcript_7604/g.16326  ORF Transcript_7604/g.16326 Transcript_7604/m.16326 type:complete len:195 (+) Transcript_7604:3-587(+)